MPHLTTRRPAGLVSTTGRLHDRDAEFLRQLASREADARARRKPKAVSAEEHIENRKQLEGVLFIKKKYASQTKVNVAGIFGKWKRYCEETKLGDWKEAMLTIRRATMQDFFYWIGRTSAIKSWGTSLEYIRQFSQLHTTITGRYPDRNDMKELYKYHDTILLAKFGWRAPNTDGKPVLNVDSLRVILTFNIAYDTSIFPLELTRVHQSGCYMIICYTGIRPAELVDNERKAPKDGSLDELFRAKVVMRAEAGERNGENDEIPSVTARSDPVADEINALLVQETVRRDRVKALCYEDILLMVVRHPVTMRATLAMSIKFVHHKGCDSKPKPTIFFFTPSNKLIFCPILLFVSIALFDHAFASEHLKDAASVLGTRVPKGMQCLPLRWKESKLKTPFFRRVNRDGTLSENEAMLYSTLNDRMGQQSLDAGFETKWTARFGRRGAANAANGDAPDSVRDQMMRQDPRFFTFWNAYLNQIANFHLQNAFLEEEKEDQLFRLFAHVSLTRDSSATRDMVPPDVWANAPLDPEIGELEKQRAELKQGHYRFDGRSDAGQIRALTNKIRSKRAQRERGIIKQYHEYYFYNRPNWELDRQARGEDDVEEYREPAIDLTIPERARLAELLCHQPTDLSDEERRHQSIEVIDLYVALCGKRETVKRKRRQAADDEPPESKRVKREPETLPHPDPFPLIMGTTQCPDCIGDERLTVQERTFPYCRPTKRNDHFDDHHLEEKERAERLGEPIACPHPKCRMEDVKLRSVDHYRNHALRVHNTKLRTSDQALKRRSKA